MATVKGFTQQNDNVLHGKISHDVPLYQGMAKAKSLVSDTVGLAYNGEPISISSIHKGYLPDSFLNSIYNRLYITPQVIDVGYVSSTKTVRTTIFNGFFTSKILTSITYSDNGQGVKVRNMAPILFSRIALKNFDIDIESEGRDTINCTIIFHFLNTGSISLTIKGNRSLPFELIPNWSNGITEKLEWKTNIHTSQTGAEQRVSMRLTPRRTFEFQALIYKQERNQIENKLFKHYSSTFSLPIYSDITKLTKQAKSGDSIIYLNTTGRDYYISGHLMLSNKEHTTVAEIAALTDYCIMLTEPLTMQFNCGDNVYPVKSAKLTDPPIITRKTDELSTLQLRFTIIEHNPLNTDITLPTYRGFYVLECEPDWSNDIRVSYESQRTEIDNQTGLRYFHDSSGRVFNIQSHHFIVGTRREQRALRALFYTLRGRQKPIFVPSFSHDVYVTDDIKSELMNIENNGMSETIKSGQFIRFILNDGEILYREIFRVQSNDNNGGLILILDEKANINKTQILKVSMMRLCRLNDDTVTWEHLTDADGVAKVSVEFREVRYELE